MNLLDILDLDLIDLDMDATDKDGVLKQLSSMLYKKGNIKDLDKFLEAVYERESIGETGLGGIAIPHGLTDQVINASVAIGKVKQSVEWESLDDQPVSLIFLLAAPTGDLQKTHLQNLSQLASVVAHKAHVDALMKCETKEEFFELFGITSCTCGIAHTYMAREKLLETGEKFGWSVKIETQGSGGVEFALTDEDINAADCVLIASDVAVSGTERFKGKPMVKVPVATAIKSPEHLLRKIEEKLGALKK